MRKNYKKLAAVMAIIILALAMSTTGFAENATKNLKAYYRNITVYRNGAKVNFSNEPFILDDGAGGTTYVPLRDVSEMLGNQVSWNGQAYRIDIAGNSDADLIALQARLVQQEVTIKNLEAKIKELESKKTNISSLSDMESYLNKEYGSDTDVDFDIKLSGSKTKVTIEINVDNKKANSNEFQDWTSKEKKNFAEDLVDAILKEFSSATISGSYRDKYAGTKESFSVSKNGTVTMGKSSSSIDDLADLEDLLNDEFPSKSGVKFDIEVSGSTSKVKLYIDAYNDDLYELTDSQIKSYLEDIYDFIMDELDPNSITGTIGDVDGDIDFTFTSSGTAKLN